MKENSKLYEINVLKGIAIAFLVLAHLPVSVRNHSMQLTISSLKAFMHIFMFCSGYLYGVSGTKVDSLREYFAFIKKKFRRLMFPYFSVAIVMLAIKYFAGFLTKLKYPVNGDFWKHIFINPFGGFAHFLWFLYVLFIIFIFFALLQKALKNQILLITVALAIHFSSFYNDFFLVLKYVQYYLVFFCVGHAYSKINLQKIEDVYKIMTPVFFIAFGGLLLWKYNSIKNLDHYYIFNVKTSIMDLIISLLSIFAFYFLSVYIARNKNILFRIINYIGIYSAAIYLFHTTFIGGAYFILLKFIQINNYSIPFLAISVFLSGIIIPILVAKHIFYKNKYFSLFLLGVDNHINKYNRIKSERK